MADGLFVVNASPLILLAAIDGLPLLPQLAGEILVPAAVVREVRAGRDPHPALLRLESTARLSIEPSRSVPEDIGGWISARVSRRCWRSPSHAVARRQSSTTARRGAAPILSAYRSRARSASFSGPSGAA